MTLEERIAAALWDAIGGHDDTTPDDEVWIDLARAVVAVLPTADVSDEQIAEAFINAEQNNTTYYADNYVVDAETEQVVAVVRALLDAQAAAHAAEVEALTEDRNNLRHVVGRLEADARRDRRRDRALITAHEQNRNAREAEVEALRTEVERLTESLDYANQGKAALEVEVANRDRAVAEALENAAQKIEDGPASYITNGLGHEAPWDLLTRPAAARIVRSLIPRRRHRMSLPPIPTDPESLAMLRDALDPGPDAERSSLWDLLTMWSQLGGSDTEAVEEVIVPGIMPDDDPDVVLMRDPHYHPNDVILALVGEVEALRAENERLTELADNAIDWKDHLTERAETAEAEVEALRNERDRAYEAEKHWVGIARKIEAARDRAVAEALEHAADAVDEASSALHREKSEPDYIQLENGMDRAAAIVRGLIPNGDEA